jgi:hypothetical protein
LSFFKGSFSNLCDLRYKEIDEDVKLSFIDTSFPSKGIDFLAYDTKFRNPNNKYPSEGDREDIRLYPILENKKYLFSQTFSRPKLLLPKPLQKDINISINLNLPIEELIEYVKNIKSTYDKEEFLFHNTSHMIKEWEEQRIDLKKIEKEVLLLKQLPKEYSKHKTKQEKYADMFFIYDALQIGMSQAKIAHELDCYNYRVSHKESHTDVKTIRKYRDAIKPYIEDRKYLELYTNLSIEKLDLL